MARIPRNVHGVLGALTHDLPNILGKNLFGVYLYGSLTQGAFNPKTSDIDCIAVTHRDLSDAQFKKLDAWLKRASHGNPWFAKLQMSVLTKTKILTIDAKCSYYQFGVLKRTISDGNPIIWINVVHTGVALFGPPPKDFVPEITSKALFQALEREVGYLREELCTNPASEWRDVPFYRAYAVLTLCRILYSAVTGRVVSKPKAAEWAAKRLPRKWNVLIEDALAADYMKLRRDSALRLIRSLIDFVDAELRSSPLC